MEYFVPAWHEQYDDWSISIPTIDLLDATSYMRVLQDNDHRIGLIVSDYQPQLTTRLNQLSYYPDKLFSVYDYLQGIDTLQNRVIELDDLNWPDNAIFDFSPFRTLIVVEDKRIATVFYDIEGKILRIEYPENDSHEGYSLLMDSRGFVSSKSTRTEQMFYDPYGNWRFKKNYSSGEITINPKYNFCQKNKYTSINELINEVLQTYLIANLKDQDNLIVSLDDNATVDIKLFKKFKTSYIINEKLPYQNQLKSLDRAPLIVNQPDLAKKVAAQVENQDDIHIIPTYNSEFRLGHSAREKVQSIVFFAEKASDEDIGKIIPLLCKYVKKDYKNKKIRIFTYSLEKDNRVNQVLDEAKKKYHGQFIIGKENKDNENSEIEGLDKKTIIPIIDLKKMRLTNISELLKDMDRARVLISWGKADELMQIAGISIGIPQIQNFVSSTVIDQKNGYICSTVEDINSALDKYLNNLTAWNNAVVYNVDMMNRYSEENIMKRWQKILGDK